MMLDYGQPYLERQAGYVQDKVVHGELKVFHPVPGFCPLVLQISVVGSSRLFIRLFEWHVCILTRASLNERVGLLVFLSYVISCIYFACK